MNYWNESEGQLLERECPVVEMRENIGVGDMNEGELAVMLWMVAQRANEIGWTFKELVEYEG